MLSLKIELLQKEITSLLSIRKALSNINEVCAKMINDLKNNKKIPEIKENLAKAPMIATHNLSIEVFFKKIFFLFIYN